MNPPNLLTCLRILLVPFFFTALVSYQPGKEKERWIAFFIFLVAALTDALDGFIARLTKSRTDLGRFLDPFADKLLLLSGYLGLLFVPTLPYRPPLWITVTIVFRDAVIILGLIVIFLMSGAVRVEPNILGKFTTGSQMVALIAVLLQNPLSPPLYYFSVALTIASCFSYIIRELKRLQNHS